MINFEIGLRLSDAQLKSGLAGIRSEIDKAFTIRNKDGGISKEIAAATYQAKALEKALTAATTNKGISYAQLNVELAKAGTTAGKLTATLAAGGSAFSASLNTANNALALSNRQVLSLNKTLQEAGRVFKQSLKFTVAQTAIRAISQEVKESIQWVKNLNDAVNEIAVVTGKTGTEIDKVTDAAVKGSHDLRIAAEDYARGALIFYQQGLNDEEVTRRNEITIKAAKAANQSIDEMSKQLTAIWNTYGMVGDEQLRAASVGAKMAAQTAVDFSDIAQAMQTAAAPAAQMGVEYNQLAAIIATVGDATQQSASIIGNAYKTIFSRFQQLVSDGTDGEVTLGAVSSKLQNLGVQLLNSDGTLKNLGQTINEVGQNWNNWTEEQQLAIAQLVGGTRQYGQFLSLMQNFDKYQKNLNSARAETGSTLEQQYTQALDSIESRAENAAEAWHRAFSNVFNADQIKTFYKVIEQTGEAAGSFLEAIGGAPGIFFAIATLLSGKIVPSLATAVNMGKQFGLSLTPGGRESTIKKDFNEQREKISNDNKLSADQKAIATSKANFSQNTALANERINQQLKTATGEYRVQLEMQKEQLETAQRTYQESLDEENSLKRKVELDQIRVNKLREALAIMDETQAANQQELANAQSTQQNAVAQQRQAQADLNNLLNTSQGKFSSSEEMEEKMKNQESIIANGAQDDPRTRATIRNYEELEGRIKQVVAAEEKLKQATLEVAKANDAVAAAQKKVNMDQEAAKAADLAGKYNEIAQAVVKYDQARMLEGGGGKESDALIARIEEYIRLAPQASEEVEELNRRLEKLKNGEEGASLESVLEGIQNVNAATGADGVETNGIRVTQNADALIDEHTRQEQAIKAQEEAQKKLAEQQKLTLQQGISAAVQFGMVLTSVTMAVKNLISVWSDDSDATIFEKIGKSIGIIGTMALTAIPSVMSIISAVTALGTAAGATGMAAFKAGLMAQTGLGPLLPVVLAIAAAVVALTVVIGLIADAIKKADPHYQLEQAQKDAAAFAESLNEAKQEAEELKKAFDSYDEIQNKLKRCTIGTQEWKDALQEANSQVLELIRKYPELASHVETSMVNGQRVLSINKEGMDALQKQQDTIVANLTAASVSSNQRVRDAEIAVQKSDLVKEVGYNTLTTTREYQAGQGYSGSQSYQVGQTSAVIDKYMKEILSATPDQMEALAEKIIKEQNLDQSVDSVKKTLEEMIPSLQEYDAAITEATEAKKIENQMLADSIIQNSAKLSSVKDSNAMEAGGAVYSNAYKKAYDDALKAAQSRTWYNGGTEDSKASFKAYAEGLKLKDWKVTNYKGSGKDASVEYEYYDDEGKKQTGEATAEMIARFNAAAVAGEELENSLIALAKEADRLADSEDSGDQALSSFLGKGNLEGATQGQFNDIKNDVQEAGDVRKYLEEQFDDLEKVAESAGYADAEAFVKAFEESLQIDWDSIPEGLSDIESLTLEQAKALGETYTKVMNISGEQAAEQYANAIKGISESVDTDDLMTVQSMFAAIDWTNEDALNNFANGMRDLGYEIDINDKEWAQLADTMKATFKVQPDLDKLVASIKEANDIAEGIDLGNIISQEDYQTLVAYNSELSKYFTILADGTAMMTGDILDFQQEMRETEQKKLEDAIAAYKQQVQELEGVSGSQNYVNDKGENKYRTSNVNTQLDYIEANGGASAEQIAAWREDLSDNQSTVGTIDAIGEAFDKLGINAETAQTKLQQAATQLALSQETFEDLRGTLNGTEEATIAYAQALESMHNEEKWEGMDPKEVENYAKGLQKAAKQSDLLSDELEENAEAAEDVALYTKKMNQGIDKLAGGFKDWSDILKKSDKSSEEYISAMSDMKDAMSDVLGVSEEFLSDDFILKNMEDIKLAAEGDADAINRLAIAAGEDIIIHLGITDEGVLEQALGIHNELAAMIPDIEVGATLTGDDEFVQKALELIKTAGMSADQANAYFRSIGFEPNFEFETVTQKEAKWGERTVTDDVQLGSKDVGTEENPQKYYYVKRAFTHTEPVFEGFIDKEFAVPKLSADGTPGGNISFTRTNNGSNNNYSKSNAGGGSPGGGSKSSGGGSKTKTPEHKSKKAEKRTKLDDRYSTIKSKIEDVARALEDYSNAEDDAFGAAKLAAMQKQEQSLVQQAKHYKTLRQMALNYLKVDQKEASSGKNRTDLKAKLSELGLDNNLIDVQYDDDGYIANRTEIIQQLDALLESKYNVYKAAADAYDSNKSTDEAESERIDALKDEYEGLDKLVQLFIGDLDQVDETAAEARQALLDELEKIREWMQKKVDQANYKLELRIGINEMDIKMMELTIKLWDKLGVKMGSTFNNLHKILTDSADSLQGMIENSNRMWEILDNISPDSEHQDWFKKEFGEEAWQEYLNGNGALPTSVIENLEEKADSMLSELSGMYDTAEEMLGQFVEAMNMFLEDFDKIADKLARQNEKLDMFEELLDFSGKKYSVEGRDAMMGILKARMDNAKVAVANAKAEQEFTKVAVEEAKASLEQFYAQEGRDVNSYDDTAAFFYNQLKNTLDEAEAAAAEAESNFYQSMQELTAAARAAIEESARIIEEELVDSLGGIFDSFDSGLDMYQHQDDMYNFFLDDYDKGYELKKLLGEIEDAMEDVTDPERLAEWGTLVDDINAANQDGVKITQTDLDILKARFDLQKAYDEYTDARAGKNTMRLQRDASGNYSYVYSSDNNSEADDNQQKIEDALHNIHKMHREAADEMQSMWFQTYVEMEKYMSEVDQLRLQNDAKYAAEVEWYKGMYQQKLEHYRDQTIQHNTAIDRSYEETTLGIITGMEDMEGTHEWYMEQAHKYDEKLKESALSWEAQVRDTCNENGINYDNLEKVVKEDTDKMIDENKALKDEINRLKTEGTASLRSLGSQIRSFVSQGVSKLREMKRAVEELIQKLQELKRLRLAQENAKSSYYDETTDYSALGANLFREAVKRGEFSEDEYEKFLRQNSFIVDQVYAAQMQDTTRGQYYKGNDSSYSWEDALKHIIAAQGTDRTDWNFRDTSKIEVNGNIVITGDGTWDISTGQKIPETASGGLIVKEQVRSLAEEGPELVLNAEDTKNILEAVRLVRQNVEAQLGARMMTQMSELQKLAENVDYHRYGLDDQYKAYVDAAIAGQEQKVQIEANFPGVTVASEIEEAFNQLVTQAAQYRIRQDR